MSNLPISRLLPLFSAHLELLSDTNLDALGQFIDLLSLVRPELELKCSVYDPVPLLKLLASVASFSLLDAQRKQNSQFGRAVHGSSLSEGSYYGPRKGGDHSSCSHTQCRTERGRGPEGISWFLRASLGNLLTVFHPQSALIYAIPSHKAKCWNAIE